MSSVKLYRPSCRDFLLLFHLLLFLALWPLGGVAGMDPTTSFRPVNRLLFLYLQLSKPSLTHSFHLLYGLLLLRRPTSILGTHFPTYPSPLLTGIPKPLQSCLPQLPTHFIDTYFLLISSFRIVSLLVFPNPNLNIFISTSPIHSPRSNCEQCPFKTIFRGNNFHRVIHISVSGLSFF